MTDIPMNHSPGPRGEPDGATLSTSLRVICVGNAVVWLIAQPPWFEAAPLSTASAIGGAVMWALLGIGGNRPGRVRGATLFVASAYLGMMVAKLLADGL